MSSELERLQDALPRRYTLLRELDRGGMSRVYLGREELPGRDVAVKVFDPELSARLGRERFIQEVEVTSRLQHPHILPIFSAGDADDALYYTMPYVDGGSLRDRLDREGPLELHEVVGIVGEVAGALTHAHAEGIVHRDIQPAKILFQSGHAVVSDFGIARALRVARRGAARRPDDPPVGHADYLSPEQIADDGTVSGATDTYSLACVVYEALSGSPPFRSRTTQGTLARHLTDPVPSLCAERPSLPSAVERVVERALAKRPSDRYASVADFADALATAADVRRAVPIDPIPDDEPRRRVPRLVSGVAAGLLVVAGIGIALQIWASGLFADDPYRTHVAVMPFENRTGNPELDYLGPSLAEMVITQLAAVPEIAVKDLYTAASLSRDSLGTPRLLDTLAVAHVIHGYIEAQNDSLVVNVSESDDEGFLSIRTRHPIALDRVDREQARLANTVAQNFLREVGLEDRSTPELPVVGPGRDAYLAGTEALGRRTPSGMRDAVRSFREAIDREPSSSAALSALSSAYALAIYYKYDLGLTSYEMAIRSLAAADSAVSLNPAMADGYAARGYVRALLGIEIAEAEADFAEAERLAPNAPNAPSWSARILARRGEVQRAFAEARRARDLDPLQAGRRTALASLAFQMGEYDVTIQESREAYRLEPALSLARAFEGRALALTGRGEECLELDFGVYELVRALCLHAAGRATEARRIVARTEEDLATLGARDRGYLPELVAQDLATYHGFVGNPDRAAEWIRRAFERSPAGVDERLLASALFDPVRSDPDWAAAVADARIRAQERVLELRERFAGEL